jgi:4-diphosphocytidyl-2C-methyl-D-erythritol kinase
MGILRTEEGAIELETPAKLNLGLRLMGVRADGYHLLESVFAPVELFDRVEIEILPGSRQIELEVTSSEAGGLPPALSQVTSGPDNLAFRAAAAFCEARGVEARIRIRLEKTIPAAAGMGGGSSDAAAVLNGLRALAGPRLERETVDGLALDLGADVPFFLDPRPSLVEGIGEIITPLEGLPSSDLVIANPGISLDTAEVYRAADALASALTEPRPGSTMRAFSRLCHENGDQRDGFSPIGAFHLDANTKESARTRAETAAEIGPETGPETGAETGIEPEARLDVSDRWDALLINDLEPAARRLCPPVGRLLAAMREAGAIGAGMTGSGATVFGVFESSGRAQDAADRLRGTEKLRGDPAWILVSRLIGRG